LNCLITTIKQPLNYLETITFANNIDAIRNFTLDCLPAAIQEKISQERKEYLWKEIREHISIGGKIYKKYQSKGFINYRAFTCLRSETITGEEEISNEAADLRDQVKSNSLFDHTDPKNENVWAN